MSNIGQYFTSCFDVLKKFFDDSTYLGNVIFLCVGIGLICAVANIVLFVIRPK